MILVNVNWYSVPNMFTITTTYDTFYIFFCWKPAFSRKNVILQKKQKLPLFFIYCIQAGPTIIYIWSNIFSWTSHIMTVLGFYSSQFFFLWLIKITKIYNTIWCMRGRASGNDKTGVRIIRMRLLPDYPDFSPVSPFAIRANPILWYIYIIIYTSIWTVTSSEI